MRGSSARYWVALIGLVGVATLSGGCQEINWEREWAWWNPNSRAVRPARSVRPQPRQTPSKPETPVPDAKPVVATPATPTVSAPSRRPVEVQPLPEAPTVEEGLLDAAGMYRLVLMSGPGVLRREPTVQRVRLKRARVEAVAELIEMILPGLGRGGAADRQYLLYRGERVWRLASHFAVLLDVDALEAPPSVTPATAHAAFRVGAGMVLAMLGPGRPAGEQVKQAETLLAMAAQSGQAERPLRWAAAMVAGTMMSAGRFERFDFAGARQHYLVAQRHSQPLSFPHMAALYARADTYIQEGQPAEALELMRRIKEDYLLLHHTSLYERARNIVMR